MFKSVFASLPMAASSIVVVTRRLPAALVARLASRPRTTLRYHDSDEQMAPEQLLAAAQGASAIVCTLADAISPAVIAAAAPSLRVVSSMSVGYSHVDVAALRALAPACRLGNTPGVLTDATADLVVGLALAAGRRLVEAAAAARSGEWRSWKPFWMCGKGLSRARVGIVGMGRIGEAVAQRLRGFGCDVMYDGRSGPKPAVDAVLGTRHVSRAELYATSEFVVVLCALTAETRGLIGLEALRSMREDVIFINASRGEVVDQAALAAVLAERPAMRAGLDVTAPEPLPLDSPLFAAANCLVLPHIGSASDECRAAMAAMTVENAMRALDGAAELVAEVKL